MRRGTAMAGAMAALTTLMTGCAHLAVGALNKLEPGHGVTLAHDVAYASGPRHQLDVYAPAHGARAAPVVVFFYGGGWDSGDRAMYRFVGKALASPGAPPVLLAHDEGDRVVAIKNTINLAAKLQANGDEVETRYYRGVGHARLVASIASPLRFMAPVLRDLTAFIDAHSTPAAERKAAA